MTKPQVKIFEDSSKKYSIKRKKRKQDKKVQYSWIHLYFLFSLETMFKHPADNHESQPEKRRRAEASSSGQLPLSKTANKHGIANTLTKTSPAVVTEPTQPPPSTSTTPSATTSATTTATPSATQAPKSTSAVGKDSTGASSEIQMYSNVKAGDSSALKPPQQASSTPLPING
jgi:hypothetical protein